MIKQLLHMVITKWLWFVSFCRSVICLSFQLQQQIDLLTTDISQYFAQPHPIIVATLFVSAGTTVKVHVVDLENERVTPYVNVRPLLSSTVSGLKTLIHEVRKLVFVTGWTGFKMFQFDNMDRSSRWTCITIWSHLKGSQGDHFHQCNWTSSRFCVCFRKWLFPKLDQWNWLLFN